MAYSSDNSSSKIPTTPIAKIIHDETDFILETWVKEVKKQIHFAKELQVPIIVNTIPVFIGNLAEALDGNIHRETANDSNNVAEEHGSERARVTNYRPDHVVQEYVVLRQVIHDVIRKHMAIDDYSFSIIQRSFDEATQKAMMAFHLIHNEIRENVVTHLTHDLRTPLTAAKLSMDLILRTLKKDNFDKDKLITLVNKSKISLDYINELIQNMLDEKYLQSVEGATSEKFEPAEMLDILRSAISSFSEDEKNLIKLSGDRVEGYWEKKSLRRLAENLLSNALKYGEENKVIELKVCATHGRVLISFHNYGNPIPMEEIGLLFNNFQRSKSAEKGSSKGWGLGLSYCREVVEHHAGSLGVESRLETGTTFTVDILIDPREVAIK